MDAEEQLEQQDVLAVRKQLILRKEVALQGLNMRIARLAIALGLELDTDVGLRMALETGPALAPHQRSFQEELRGLLTLRYQMEAQLVDAVGSQAMHGIVADVEQQMDRIGFRHGMDGTH